MRIPGLKACRRTAWRIRGTLFGNGAILGYHRIADDPEDPWENCVGPAAFAEHMEVLRRDFHPVPLGGLVHSQNGSDHRGRRPPVAVTFDDGYAEVLQEALPILERYDLPATIFVVADAAGSSFWWDRLRLILEQPAAPPPSLDLEVAGVELRWTEGNGLGTLPQVLHGALRGISTEAREEALSALEAWVGTRAGADTRARAADGPSPGLPRSLDEKEILLLAEHPLVELGSHGATHQPLPGLPGPSLRTEIGESRRRLERLISRPVHSFSYPFGLLDGRIRDEVARAGYGRACSSRNGLISRGTDPLRLPRLWPPDGNGAVMRRWLRSWTGR